MKRWQIVYALPLEVWMDIFCFPWTTRKQFGQLVDRIGNFKFAEHAQFYLHDWGKRALDMDGVHFDEKGLYKRVGLERIYMDIPQTPLPPNITKCFDRINIWHFDAKAVDFLGRIRPLLTDMGIIFCASSSKQDGTRIIFSRLAPLLDSIHLLRCNENALPVAQQCFGDKFDKLKVLKVSHYRTGFLPVSSMPTFNIVMNWLIPPQPAGRDGNDGPRFCELQNTEEFFTQIHTAVRQQFLVATNPNTFAVNLMHYYPKKLTLAEFHLENGIGEQLDGKWIERKSDNEGTFQITRHGADWSTEELQEWSKEVANERRLCQIEFHLPTIGSLAAAQVDVQPVDEEQDEQQPQSCSKYA